MVFALPLPTHPLVALGCYRAKLGVRRRRVTWASTCKSSAILAQWRLNAGQSICMRSCVFVFCILACCVSCILKYNTKPNSEAASSFILNLARFLPEKRQNPNKMTGVMIARNSPHSGLLWCSLVCQVQVLVAVVEVHQQQTQSKAKAEDRDRQLAANCRCCWCWRFSCYHHHHLRL